MTNVLLSLGHGYSAQALAERLLPQGWTVLGTTRDASKADRLRAAGIVPVGWTAQAVEDALAQATHLLVSAGPDAEGDRRCGLPRRRSRGGRQRWTGSVIFPPPGFTAIRRAAGSTR